MFNKVFVATAALVAAQAVSAAEYLPLQNPGNGKCILKGAFNKGADYFALKLGSCTDTNVLKLTHVGKGKQLQTSDKWCVDAKSSANTCDDEIVLRKCDFECVPDGQEWCSVGVYQWKNDFELCLEYNDKDCKFQQRKCADLPKDCATSLQQWKFYKPPPPPPPPAPTPPCEIKCSEWGKTWECPKDYALESKRVCTKEDQSLCEDVCCVPCAPPPPPPPSKTCRSAGFAAKCPSGYEFVDVQCGNPGQDPCNLDTCCEPCAVPPPPPPPRTCRSAGFANKCPSGYEFADMECGSDPLEPCNLDTCCEPCEAPAPPPPPPCELDCEDDVMPPPEPAPCDFPACDEDGLPITCDAYECEEGWEPKPDAADIYCQWGELPEDAAYTPPCERKTCCDLCR